jgi:hypothetical protein
MDLTYSTFKSQGSYGNNQKLVFDFDKDTVVSRPITWGRHRKQKKRSI